MPLYYFHLDDEADSTSFEAANLAAAKCEATKMAGQIICDDSHTFWEKAEWVLTVTNADNLMLFQLRFVGIEAPAIA